MAKCKAIWFGNDSSGRSIEIALSIEDLYFYRVYEFNGYNKAWSKWCNITEISHPVSYINTYDKKRYYWNEDKSPNFNIIEWGFKILNGGYVDDCRYRLPNKEAA